MECRRPLGCRQGQPSFSVSDPLAVLSKLVQNPRGQPATAIKASGNNLDGGVLLLS